MPRLTRDMVAEITASSIAPRTFVVTLPDSGLEIVMAVLPWVVQQQMAALGAKLAGQSDDARADAAAASPASILRRAIVDDDLRTPLFDTPELVDAWLNSLTGRDLAEVMEGLVHIQRESGLIPEAPTDGPPAAPTLADLGKALSTLTPD